MREQRPSSLWVVISRAQQVGRVCQHQDRELIQFDVSASCAGLDCHFNYVLDPTQPLDWQEAHSSEWILEGSLDFILTREFRLYLNQQKIVVIMQKWLL
jgi:hypothetical protein